MQAPARSVALSSRGQTSSLRPPASPVKGAYNATQRPLTERIQRIRDRTLTDTCRSLPRLQSGASPSDQDPAQDILGPAGHPPTCRRPEWARSPVATAPQQSGPMPIKKHLKSMTKKPIHFTFCDKFGPLHLILSDNSRGSACHRVRNPTLHVGFHSF